MITKNDFEAYKNLVTASASTAAAAPAPASRPHRQAAAAADPIAPALPNPQQQMQQPRQGGSQALTPSTAITRSPDDGGRTFVVGGFPQDTPRERRNG